MDIIRNNDGVAVETTLRKPDDWHQHFRRGELLKLVVKLVAQRFYRAIVMPNPEGIINTTERALKYMTEILTAREESGYENFIPLMTLYLTDTLEPEEVYKGFKNKVIYGIKYYPPGKKGIQLTTNSGAGISDPALLWTKGTKPYECLRALAECGGVFLMHGADGFAPADWYIGKRDYRAGDELDPYDQEIHFVERTLPRIMDAHPTLKKSFEHLSTAPGAEFLRENGGERLGCALTVQHLSLDRRDNFRGGIRPHTFWWPIIQPLEHRQELCKFLCERHPFVWLGSDSAPHPLGRKETDCCTGGVMIAHGGIEFYLEAFEDLDLLDWFEEFASVNGARFYGLPLCDETITLVRKEWRVSRMFYCGGDPIWPFRLGEKVRWKLRDIDPVVT